MFALFTDEMHLARQKSRSDAEFYQMQKQAEANRLLLTPQYLELRKFESIASNNKVYFGNDIPKMFMQGGCNSDTKSNEKQHVESLAQALSNNESDDLKQQAKSLDSSERMSVRS